jgi:TorA maturation chaperone TorD
MSLEDTNAVLIARAEFYRMLSRFFFKPLTQEEIDHMAQSDYAEYRQDKEESLLAQGFDDIYRYLRKRNTGTRQELAADFTGVFLGSKSYKGHYAIPNESLFRDPSGLLMRGPRNEVYFTFKQARLKLKEGLNLPDDHLSFEFEFMGVLCDRALGALQDKDYQACIDNLNTQKTFCEAHILSWFDRFFALSNKMIETRFYRGILKVTKGFLQFEQQDINETIATIEALP